MKKFISPLLLSAIIGISSCSDKFDIAAPYKEVTVVYGIMNMNDTAHYIRIQKAFMDESKSAVDMAKEEDSSFYKNLKVELIESDIPEKNSVKRRLQLTRVQLTDKDNNGAFFPSPNYAYRVELPDQSYKFSPFWAYKLIITNQENGRVDSSKFFRVVNSAFISS